MAIIMQEQKFVCRQPVRNEIVKITILNKDNLVIGEISGKVLEGSISLDSTSFIRRSGNLKLILDSETFPSQNNYLWVTNKCKISIGILNLLTSEYCWFNLGTFLFKDLNMSYSSTDKTISLNLLDPMCQFDGTLGGVLENDIKIANMGVTISEAIKACVVQLGGESENNILISNIVDDNNVARTLPYTLTKTSGNLLLDAIKEIASLYKYTQVYYNELGQFVCEPTHTLLSDPISEDFRDIDFTINSQVSNDFSYIKNRVIVKGISVTPLVSVADEESTDNLDYINSSTGLKIIFNKALYNSTGTEVENNTNLTDYFTYNGTASKYTSAIYNKDDWSITFNISGENGKLLIPKTNMIFDSTAIDLSLSDGGYVYSSVDACWSRLLSATLLTPDEANETTKFELDFNKPLYNASGVAIATGTSLKSAFTYSGESSRFLDAIYTIDNGDYYITLTFSQTDTYDTIMINKDGTANTNSVYDSAGVIYDTKSFIMTGSTWSTVDDGTNTSVTQISAEVKNEDDTSPYSINNIGEKLMVITEGTIYTKAQASIRGQYELELHSNLNESISLSCLSLPYLDVNMLIYLLQEQTGIDGKYVISKISYNLGAGTMSLTCNKVYF